MDDWNVLATSVEGARPVLLAGLRRRGAFRGGGYRNVAIGRVGDVPAFLAGLRDDVARDTVLAGALARVLPIDHTFRLDGDDPMTSLETAVGALHPRLAGESFFVRLERRGLHGTLHTSEVERALGTVLWRPARGARATRRASTFADPDVIIAIETLGDRAGVAVIERALRAGLLLRADPLSDGRHTLVEPSRLPPSRAWPTRGSPITFTTDALARGERALERGTDLRPARVTCSPWQPMASNIRS